MNQTARAIMVAALWVGGCSSRFTTHYRRLSGDAIGGGGRTVGRVC